ncbi:MAG TPA: efflux RND transporter permease subunit [Opitutaceae bacterium]|nr:efflux RND transporter permease subunit [Opitutaceae bacterium]
MKFTDLFIKKPVIAIVVSIAILVIGAVSYFGLNVRQYPRSDSAVVSVTTVYFGASADTVRGYITTQLEQAIASADGIDYIESQSREGLSTISVYLRLNYDTNAALAQISSKIDAIKSQLPPEAETPTIDVQTADNQFASMYLSFYSDKLEQNQITDYLNRVVQPQLASIKGVQRAEVLGGRIFAIRVWLQPDRMAARGISPSQVRLALQENNALAAVGATKGSMLQVNLTANTDLKSVEDFERMVVTESNGSLVRLGDIAKIELGAEDYNTEVRFGGQKATFMGIWVLPTESTVEVIKRVREVFPNIQSRLPAGLEAKIAYDATKYIDDALHEILKTLSETLMIVMVVIFVFMGSLRSVLIPIVAMPLSLIGALFLMKVMGFTINLLTLLAIVLAVGLVVDDAIVVVENVERHIREGRRRVDAAILGARELLGPVISMTITLAAVYAPIGFQGGLTGALFREFAFTLAGAVTVSGIVALTLSPMMSAYLLKDAAHESEGLSGFINSTFDRIRDGYENLIGFILQPAKSRQSYGALAIGALVAFGALALMGIVFIAIVAGPASLGKFAPGILIGSAVIAAIAFVLTIIFDLLLGRKYTMVPIVLTTAVLLAFLVAPFLMFAQPKELAPHEDQGVVFTIVLPGPNATIDHNLLYSEQIQKMFASLPEYDTSFQLTSTNFGFSGVLLKPWSERHRNATEIAASLQGPASQIVGVNAVVNTPDPLPSGGQFPIEFVIRSTADHREMLDYANKLVLYANTEANEPGAMPTFYFADSDLKFDFPQTEIIIEKDKVAAMGLNLQDVARDLGSMLGGAYVNRFVNEGRSYRVIPQVERIDRLNADQILNYRIRGPQGKLIPLSTVATLKDSVQPRTLNRFQQLNSVKITGVGPSVDKALRKLEEKAKEILPPDYTIDYGGQSRQLRHEGNALWTTFALAVVLIFLVLAAQFNSFRDPFIILLGSVPLALVSALLPIFLWKTTINIYSQIGMITLVGLIAKNGILIVEFANKLQEDGMSRRDAARRAAATRLRPVLMTSAATVFGHMMLIFVTGPGAAARNSIGWVLVVGMAIGTFFTLFVVPAFYVLLAKDHSKESVSERAARETLPMAEAVK